MSEAIAIRGLGKRFGSLEVLSSIDLDVHRGEFMTLLGASGSGKSSLLMVIAGFMRPDTGSVRIAGAEILTVPPHRRDIGVVFQNYALFPHLSVADNIAYPLKVRRVGAAEKTERVRRALDMVQLSSREDWSVDRLSGGQRQRVALARAIVYEPRILLLDEPLSALDKNLREDMQIELKHLHDRLGMTMINVTHDQKEAFTISDRIAVMDAGRIRQVGPPRDIYDRPVDLKVAEFLGHAAFLGCTMDGDRRLWNGRPLHVDVAPAAGADRLMIRPEALALEPEPGVASNPFEATVEEAIFQGEATRLVLRLPTDETLTMQHRHVLGRDLARGQRLTVHLAPRNTVFVRAEG